MTCTDVIRRLDRIEQTQGFRVEAAQATDAQLWFAIRSGYPSLRAEHGSLAAAVLHLQASPDQGDRDLAALIDEDMERSGAEPA
jgi:hypothetical protein